MTITSSHETMAMQRAKENRVRYGGPEFKITSPRSKRTVAPQPKAETTTLSQMMGDRESQSAAQAFWAGLRSGPLHLQRREGYPRAFSEEKLRCLVPGCNIHPPFHAWIHFEIVHLERSMVIVNRVVAGFAGFV